MYIPTRQLVLARDTFVLLTFRSAIIIRDYAYNEQKIILFTIIVSFSRQSLFDIIIYLFLRKIHVRLGTIAAR